VTNAASGEAAEVRYGAGDRVRVRDWDAPGHLRTPWYVRGHFGIIERCCGTFRNPEELAFGRSGLPAQPLYRVRFMQADLWPDYRGSDSDTLDAEIYQHWLEPVK
jgi:nitrile hydratase subunit beta